MTAAAARRAILNAAVRRDITGEFNRVALSDLCKSEATARKYLSQSTRTLSDELNVSVTAARYFLSKAAERGEIIKIPGKYHSDPNRWYYVGLLVDVQTIKRGGQVA